MPNKLERRMFTTEFRAVQEDGKPTKLVGYAAVFSQLSEELSDWGGPFREKIRAGAFSRTLAKGCDCRALFNHDPNLVLGRTKNGGKSGTLRLFEDANGLRFEVDMPETQCARDLLTLVQRGDVDQCSFGFYVREQAWELSDDPAKPDVRELIDVDLFDISAVTYPAYPQTSVEARAKFMFPEGKPDGLDDRKNKQERDAPEQPDENAEVAAKASKVRLEARRQLAKRKITFKLRNRK